MAFNKQVFRKDGWQPHPRAFLLKQERGWGWLAALFLKRDIQLQLV